MGYTYIHFLLTFIYWKDSWEQNICTFTIYCAHMKRLFRMLLNNTETYNWAGYICVYMSSLGLREREREGEEIKPWTPTSTLYLYLFHSSRASWNSFRNNRERERESYTSQSIFVKYPAELWSFSGIIHSGLCDLQILPASSRRPPLRLCE